MSSRHLNKGSGLRTTGLNGRTQRVCGGMCEQTRELKMTSGEQRIGGEGVEEKLGEEK